MNCTFSNAQEQELFLHHSLSDSIQVGQTQYYHIDLGSGEVALIRLERGSFEINKEINLLVTIINPGGEIIEEINTASDASVVIFKSRSSGLHQILVRRWNGASKGAYKITYDFHQKETEDKLLQIEGLLSYFYNQQQPGLAMAILQDGKVRVEKYVGLRQVEEGLPLNTNTLLEWASLSKMVTAYAIALLIDQGKLERHAPLSKYLPQMPEYMQGITIHQLVHNLSGLRDYQPLLDLLGYLNNQHNAWDHDLLIHTLHLHQDVYFQPGSDYRYCNIGYILLSKIIEEVGGLPFADWIKQHLFDPIGMDNSFIFKMDRSLKSNLAKSYKKENGSYDDIQVSPEHYKWQEKNLEALGAAQVHSTLRDFIKWDQNYQNNKVGSSNIKQIIREGIIPEEQAWDWYYGFQRYKYRGQEKWASEGLTQGYRTLYARFPQLKTSFIFLSNDGEWRTYYLANKIIDLYLEDSLEKETIATAYRAETNAIQNTPEKTAPSYAYDPAILGHYYNTSLKTIFTIEASKGKAIIVAEEQLDLQSSAGQKDEYTTDKWFIKKLIFQRTKEQKVQSCTIYNSKDDSFFEFKKLH